MSDRVVTTVFMSGNSQAVRIPVTHRFAAEKVTIEAVPEGLLLRPLEQTMGDSVRRLRAFQAAEGIPEGLLQEIEELPLEPLPDFDAEDTPRPTAPFEPICQGVDASSGPTTCGSLPKRYDPT